MADLAVERSLYTTAGSNYYFLHFIIYNKTQKTLGIDLSNSRETIFLNQVEIIHDTSALIHIHNELFNRYQLLSSEEAQKIKTTFAAGKLSTILPGKTLDYYHEFRGGEKSASMDLFQDAESLWMYLNGRLAFTDGETVEDFHDDGGCNYMSYELTADGVVEVPPVYFNREFSISVPIEWKIIPAGAILSKG
jgi:hypothetical protein